MKRFEPYLSTMGLLSLLAGDLACVSGHDPPAPSDDPSPPGIVGAVAASTTGSGGGGGGTTTSSSSVGGAGGGSSTTSGTGGAPPFTPDCVCLAARAADPTGCTSCCRSCFDAAEIGTCVTESDACNGDVNGCQVAVDLAKACPLDQNYATCVVTAFDLAPGTSQALAQVLLDCTCNACAMECGSGDTCP